MASDEIPDDSVADIAYVRSKAASGELKSDNQVLQRLQARAGKGVTSIANALGKIDDKIK
jgi:hypothetical protein